jgi:two-component system, OmpR family, sensor histidine kinase MprB
MSLRTRLTLILASVALVVGSFSAVASYLTTRDQVLKGIDESLVLHGGAAGPMSGVDAMSDASMLAMFPTKGPAEQQVHCMESPPDQPPAAAQIVWLDGSISSCVQGGIKIPSPTNGGGRFTHVELRTVTIDGARYRLMNAPWHGVGTLQMARSLGETETLLSRLRIRLLALVSAATLVAALRGYAVARHIAKPITQLRDAAHNLATSRDFSTPINITGSGEVGSLSKSFSVLVKAVAHSQAQQQRLVADASHEMRTPLTSLRSNVELLARPAGLEANERTEVATDVLHDIDELTNLLSELVDLASDLNATEPIEEVFLVDLANGVAERAQKRCARILTVHESSPSPIQGRPRQLERAIHNLVDNAIKYSAPETPIDISISGSKVTVSDRGTGIPEQDIDHVFDRFFRSVTTRSRPGSGLGLSIVLEVVTVHNGTVFARNREGGGAEVGFQL